MKMLNKGINVFGWGGLNCARVSGVGAHSLLVHGCLPALHSQPLSAQQLWPFMGQSGPGLGKPPRLEL